MFTFKTDKSTGRYGSFYPDQHYIKIKGITIGRITDSKPHSIRLMVIKDDINEDGNPNCEWKWITLKKRFETLKEAKEFLKSKYEIIIEQFKIHIND